MKTVNIPEQILPLLINNICIADGQISFFAIKRIVEQSGIDCISQDLVTLNTILVATDKMPDISDSLKGTKIIEDEQYVFEKYYAIPQMVEVSSIEDKERKYYFTLEEWTKGEKVCK